MLPSDYCILEDPFDIQVRQLTTVYILIYSPTVEMLLARNKADLIIDITITIYMICISKDSGITIA